MRIVPRSLFLLICVATHAFAANAPEWVKQGRAADKTYKYYVGRSSSAASEQSGFNEATREAYEQAIRENFGFQTRIQSDAYESSKDVISTKRVQVLSQDIRVFGFEQVEFFQKATGDKFDVWILYRYPLAEIAREKSRLAITRSETPTGFSEQGSSSAALKNGTLEIKTTPEGASVFVDGQAFGVTPTRLSGVIEAGKRSLRLDHPGFETVDETIVLVPGNTLRVDKPLVPAIARLSITTEPPNANIVINGKQAGTSPVSNLEVVANKPLKVEITHAEANAFSTEMEVTKDEFNAKHFDLPLKNATLLVHTQPTGAEVTIDGDKAGFTPAGPKTLSAGKHEVRLRRAGFHEERLNLILRGGEKRVIEGFKLTPAKEGSQPRIWTELTKGYTKPTSNEKSFILSFQLPLYRSGQSDYPPLPFGSFGASVTALLSSWLGFEVGYMVGSRSVQYADARLTLSSHHLHFGLPILLLRRQNQHVYLSPELDYAMNRYGLQYTADTIARLAPNQSQLGYGLSAGYRYWWGHAPALALGVRLSATKYANANGLTGVVSYAGGFECAALF